MQNQKTDKLSLFEKVVAGNCVAAFGPSMAESVLSMSMFSVTVLEIVALFQEALR